MKLSQWPMVHPQRRLLGYTAQMATVAGWDRLMSPMQLANRSVVHRVIDACESAPSIDKAVGRIAGVLYPTLFIRRVDLWMRITHERLVLVGSWTAQSTRITKGTTVRVAATSFAGVFQSGGVVLSADVSKRLSEEVLENEGIRAWAAIPIPRPGRVHGVLTLSAATDVFLGARGLLEDIGLAVGDLLDQTAKSAATYVYAAESIA